MKKSTRMLLMNPGERKDTFIEDRFRDRRGREHDDDGRYAPMRNGSGYPTYIGPYEPPYYKESHERQGGRTINKIGFAVDGEMHHIPDEIEPERHTAMEYPHMDEMAYRKGERIAGYGMEQSRHLTRDMAMEWADSMENEDGTRGPHWPMEQTKQVQAQKGIDGSPLEFWIALNATYSDLCKMFKKYGINTVDAYVDFAKAFWLDDKDATKDKLAAYFTYVVKH